MTHLHTLTPEQYLLIDDLQAAITNSRGSMELSDFRRVMEILMGWIDLKYLHTDDPPEEEPCP